jgi:hypothetical protein
MKTVLKATLGLSVAALLSSTVQAGETQTPDVMAPQTVKTIDSDNQVSQLTIVRIDEDREAVLGAFEQQNTDAYIVQNEEGDLFINHLVPVEDLSDPALDVEVVDTYEVTYRGVTYTNKVIAD